MLVRAFFIALLCTSFAEIAHAQTVSTDVCPSNEKMVCTLSEVYGTKGLQQGIGPLRAGPGTGHAGGHFESSFINSLAPLNAAVGSQLTLLPLGSPGAGLIYSYDPNLRIFTVSTEDLGPILTERANTVGRYKLRLGFNYQRFSFGTLDGASLHTLPASFTHIMDPNPGDIDFTGTSGPPPVSVQIPPGTVCTTTPMVAGETSTGLCGFVRDRIDTVTDVNLRLNQFTATATFGLTNRIDVSLAIPINDVRMDVTSRATIINNSNTNVHEFDPSKVPSCPATPCLQGTFANSSKAAGIGDLVLRVKGTVWEGERAAVAIGADLRMPTGDELDFLGSGATGFKPFIIFSYAARVAPHVNLGYEVNGDSLLAGDVIPPQPVGPPASITTPSTFTKGQLPNQFLYAGGVDIAFVRRRLAGTFDLIGQRVIDARRATVAAQSFLGPCGPAGLTPIDAANSNNYCTAPAAPVSLPALTATSSSFNITSASLGAKLRVSDKFLIFGNVLIKLDDGGLRAKAVPLVGASFSF